MALIKCPECGKEISDKAESCIGCGYVINSKNKINVNKKNKKASRIIIIIIVLVVLVGAISVGSVMIYKSFNDKSTTQEKEEERNSEVEEIIFAIDNLGEITIEDKEEIERITTLYNSLSEEDKELVTNHDVLVTANNKIAMLNLSSENSDKNDKNKESQNDKQDLDSVYSSINDALWDASDNTDDFLESLNNSSDPISSYNSNLSKMDTAKDSLNDAYDSCGDYKELQSLKKKIKSAIDSLPTGKVYNTDDFNGKLEDFKEFSYDLYEAQMEVAKYIDSK